MEGDCGGGWGGRSGAAVGQGGVLCDAGGSCGSDPPPQQVLLTLSYPELSWELVGAVGQDGDAAEGLGGTDAAQPPQLWLEFDGEHEGGRVNRLLRVLSPQVCPVGGHLGWGLRWGGGWEGPG